MKKETMALNRIAPARAGGGLTRSDVMLARTEKTLRIHILEGHASAWPKTDAIPARRDLPAQLAGASRPGRQVASGYVRTARSARRPKTSAARRWSLAYGALRGGSAAAVGHAIVPPSAFAKATADRSWRPLRADSTATAAPRRVRLSRWDRAPPRRRKKTVAVACRAAGRHEKCQ